MKPKVTNRLVNAGWHYDPSKPIDYSLEAQMETFPCPHCHNIITRSVVENLSYEELAEYYLGELEKMYKKNCDLRARLAELDL